MAGRGSKNALLKAFFDLLTKIYEWCRVATRSFIGHIADWHATAVPSFAQVRKMRQWVRSWSMPINDLLAKFAAAGYGPRKAADYADVIGSALTFMHETDREPEEWQV
ncbi:MAG: hypothetical protein A3J10_03065 [Candidatus Sungbacteria bacterium RIFCSPLOWO2_02_FULL_54_10]|uniref:Uncharacterized protein n=2 Tax=Candidatus Sungiibacteriota TaxID=1817917 RepID=A0A1G2L617_9BACT|nr:MAG: hypothetical protein A2679_01440 [Candidatus Sungbacteria bacterium RIFCSPHIGHO2_01_FULL_54_26]OHA03265.1 MAG: hypothetical protein A3C92_03275 [Candidatus Sungbacteria bacterium RIFCSPHIGHO2_02_FULL_53_17]OHA07083.1 MAG: hypothetical protein A3B34_01940 [Candidatus Sungbacteria bacterium RIFCSPLOWO2_01_FULL_54_21]OHA12112.1 MAG: hypothetical protein A3J10_03065 [Candidatus Sungbacteria bacterium RIFCSPLOWO2_02_FULL_54_10]